MFEYQIIICNNLTMKCSYLKGNIICALPQLNDLFFSKSIIYITHHNKDGAVGIVLNYKIMNIKGIDLFKKLKINSVNKIEILVQEIGLPIIVKEVTNSSDFN